MKIKDLKMIARCTLIERGWTESLIKKFLPTPDKLAPNPHYKTAPEMKLYYLNHVEHIENSEDFKKLMQVVNRRKEVSKKSIETKLDNLNKYLETIKINLPELSREDLINRACSHYNSIQADRAFIGLKHSQQPADKFSDSLFIERICVNYLRHRLTAYDKELSVISGKVGFTVGYIEIRNKIFTEISIKYPWLEEECTRQREYS